MLLIGINSDEIDYADVDYIIVKQRIESIPKYINYNI